MSSLLDRLRSETRPQHEQMEAAFRLPATREEHRRWLSFFLGFVEPLERKIIAQLGTSHPLLLGRLKTDWLKEDLRSSGLSDAEISLVPRCDTLPVISTPSQALGALYVFEGSTLGGQLISRHLETTLGLSDGIGYRYFRSYGPDVGRRWQEFRTLLLQQSSPDTDNQVISSASETFVRLYDWSKRQP